MAGLRVFGGIHHRVTESTEVGKQKAENRKRKAETGKADTEATTSAT
jgi:hypothetical protein